MLRRGNASENCGAKWYVQVARARLHSRGYFRRCSVSSRRVQAVRGVGRENGENNFRNGRAQKLRRRNSIHRSRARAEKVATSKVTGPRSFSERVPSLLRFLINNFAADDGHQHWQSRYLTWRRLVEIRVGTRLYPPTFQVR